MVLSIRSASAARTLDYFLAFVSWLLPLSAQDLAPRAYIITPMHSNAVTLTYSFFDGDLLFDGEVPITGATACAHVSIFSANRWAFKPEVGLSRRWGHWVIDTYGAVWFHTMNNEFFSSSQFSPGINTQTQNPICRIRRTPEL